MGYLLLPAPALRTGHDRHRPKRRHFDRYIGKHVRFWLGDVHEIEGIGEMLARVGQARAAYTAPITRGGRDCPDRLFIPATAGKVLHPFRLSNDLRVVKYPQGQSHTNQIDP